MHITVLCLSTSLQRTAIFDSLAINEVNRSNYFRLDASGKGLNTARVLQQLEKDCVTALAPIGKDNADIFLELAKHDNLYIEPILLPGFTRECVTLIDKSTKNVTELVMDEPIFEQSIIDSHILPAEKELDEKLEKLFAKSNAFVFSGSRPKFWSKDLPSKICKKALDRGLTVLVDFHGDDLRSVLETCTPTIIKINKQEFCTTFNIPFELSQDELHAAISEKSKALQNCIVVTQGTEPTLASHNGENVVQEAEIVEVVNTIGCGDSFNAGFIHEFVCTKNDTQKSDLTAALAKGTWCASRNAESEKVGDVMN